jgi:hypothetical protein
MRPAIRRFAFLSFCIWVTGATSERSVHAADSPQEAAAQVDRLLASEMLSGVETKPAGPTSDEIFLRRVTLDIIGRLPDRDEIEKFTADTDPDKRQKVVQKLLTDERYGENWGRYWRDVIAYRRSDDRAAISLPAMTTYLTAQLNQNTPWDQIATAMITASGDVRENGQTGLIMMQGGRPEETVAEISRIFLGIQIQCAQCHDHPTDRWQRQQFHELAAFFPRVAIRPNRDAEMRSFLVVANDAPGRGRPNMNNRFRGTPEHYMPDMENPAARGTLMQPVFFATGQKLDRGTPDAERRGKLAEWITSPDNPWFARAMVNRMWSELTGEGFYEPVDDMGPDRTATAPETLDYLAGEFAASGYNVKWLMESILATEAYQRDSLSRRDADDAPMLANCPQPLRGDQLYDALTSALELPQVSGAVGPGGPGQFRRGRGGGRGPFVQTFGYDPSVSRDEVTGSIPQALMLMNSPVVNEGISGANRRGVLGRLLAGVKEDDQLTTELYLRVLARGPSPSELQTCLNYVEETNNRREAFEDILWALVNSTEFLYRR